MKSGKECMWFIKLRGMLGMVEVVSGEGCIGWFGLVLMLNDLIIEDIELWVCCVVWDVVLCCVWWCVRVW